MNKLFILVLISLFFLIFCGGTMYEGDYISYNTKYQPVEDFQVDTLAVFAVENPAQSAASGWYYKFYVFNKGAKVQTLELVARVVGSRRFYLYKKVDGWEITLASFETKPPYETVKKKVEQVIRSGEFL